MADDHQRDTNSFGNGNIIVFVVCAHVRNISAKIKKKKERYYSVAIFFIILQKE